METKLGIILSTSFSMHLLFSQKGFAYDFEFVHAFLSNQKIRFSQIIIPGWTAGGVLALWVCEHPPRRTHISYSFYKMSMILNIFSIIVQFLNAILYLTVFKLVFRSKPLKSWGERLTIHNFATTLHYGWSTTDRRNMA